MGTVIEHFGNYINQKMLKQPKAARKALLTGYKMNWAKLKVFPDRKILRARNYMADIAMGAIVNPFEHPDQSAIISIFMPCELLQAFDLYSFCVEAVSCYISGAYAEKGFIEKAEETGISETYCSYHKILLGAAYAGILPKPKMIVNTSLACDANNLTFRRLKEFYGIDQFYVDVPYEKSEESVLYVAKQMQSLVPFLEDHTGKKLDKEKLGEIIARSNKTYKNLEECRMLKKGKYLGNDLTSEMYEVFATHNLIGTPEALRYSEYLKRDLVRTPKNKGIRLLWMHTIPFYQEPLKEMLNHNPKYQIVSADVNTDMPCFMDPEHPYESMARRLVYNSFNGSADSRIERAVDMCRQMGIDGVVYFCHWGCKQTLGAAGLAKKSLEEAGFPTLILDGDGCDRTNSSNGQVSTRLGAFLEMLEGAK